MVSKTSFSQDNFQKISNNTLVSQANGSIEQPWPTQLVGTSSGLTSLEFKYSNSEKINNVSMTYTKSSVNIKKTADDTASEYTLTLPSSSGSSGQYLQTDGSGKFIEANGIIRFNRFNYRRKYNSRNSRYW